MGCLFLLTVFERTSICLIVQEGAICGFWSFYVFFMGIVRFFVGFVPYPPFIMDKNRAYLSV